MSILKVAILQGNRISFWGQCFAFLGESLYEELLRLVKSYIIDIWELCKSKLYGSRVALVRYSIEVDQRGTPRPHARARVSLVSWKGGSHALLFMVPLGLPSARPMDHGPSATVTI